MTYLVLFADDYRLPHFHPVPEIMRNGRPRGHFGDKGVTFSESHHKFAGRTFLPYEKRIICCINGQMVRFYPAIQVSNNSSHWRTKNTVEMRRYWKEEIMKLLHKSGFIVAGLE